MQQYLFRGKRKDNGEWVTGSLTVEYDGSCFITYWVSELTEPENNFYEQVQIAHEVQPETVGQYTSLKDKTGKDIYVGDVYKPQHSETCYQVMFVSGAFVGGKSIKSCMPLCWLPDEDGKDIIEGTTQWMIVISTIHDNPELVNPAAQEQL